MPSRWALGILAALVAALQLSLAARAEDRMSLGAPDAPPLATSLVREFQSVVGDRIFFSDGSAALGTRARSALAGQAAWLNRRPGLSVTIQGHADDSESLELDRELSLRRAQAVRARLIELGVAPERIRIMAFGRAMQVAECAGPPCAAQNRRAVTVIDQTVAKAVPADAVPLLPYRLAPRRLH